MTTSQDTPEPRGQLEQLAELVSELITELRKAREQHCSCQVHHHHHYSYPAPATSTTWTFPVTTTGRGWQITSGG